MNKKIRTAVAGAAIAIASIGGVAFTTGGAFAATPTSPGTPGDPNCGGQTVAWYTHLVPGTNGLGNLGRLLNLSLQEGRAIVQAYCNP